MTAAVQIAPYGTWESPITEDLLASGSIHLEGLHVDSYTGTPYVLESRPTEGGRYAIVEVGVDVDVGVDPGDPTATTVTVSRDVLPAEYSAMGSVHEYGGGSVAIHPSGRIIFTNHPTNGVFWLDPRSGQVETIVQPDPNVRFGAFSTHPTAQQWILAVRETHVGDGDGKGNGNGDRDDGGGNQDQDKDHVHVHNSIIAIDAHTGAVTTVVQGADFYQFPLFSPDGTRVCWTQWNHPDMPWTGTELYTAEWEVCQLEPQRTPTEIQTQIDETETRTEMQFDETETPTQTQLPRLINPILISGQAGAESICQPRWGPDGTLFFVSDKTGFWQLYRLQKQDQGSSGSGSSSSISTTNNGTASNGTTSTTTMAKWVHLKGLESAEFGIREPCLGNCTYVPLTNNTLVASVSINATSHLVLIDLEAETYQDLGLDVVDIQKNAVARLSDSSFVCIGSTRTAPQALYRIDLSKEEDNNDANAATNTSTGNANKHEEDNSNVKNNDANTATNTSTINGNKHEDDSNVRHTPTITLLRPTVSLSIPTTQLSVAQHISFPRTYGTQKQGLSHAIYVAPKNPAFQAPANTKPPLLVWMHGGPTSHVTPGLSLTTQYWSSRGYAYVQVNHAGSTGYGRAYRELLDGAWGVADVADAASCVAYLVAKGLVDATKVGIVGESAGGYAVLQAAWMYADLWAGGVSLYGISDLLGFAEITHKFESHYVLGLVFGSGGESNASEVSIASETSETSQTTASETSIASATSETSETSTEMKTSNESEARTESRMSDGIKTNNERETSETSQMSTASETSSESETNTESKTSDEREMSTESKTRNESNESNESETIKESKGLSKADNEQEQGQGVLTNGLNPTKLEEKHQQGQSIKGQVQGQEQGQSIKGQGIKGQGQKQRQGQRIQGLTKAQQDAIYHSRSAAYHADRIQAPLLLLQGAADTVVPPVQAWTMERVLKELGKEVETVVYDGEGHGWHKEETIRASLLAQKAFWERTLLRGKKTF
ncbi:hypothetical protein A1O3_10265 [Capronia epimyces CBS 606.96]|uniref:Peptidase S9 prolyl oligopeptidase catalytic domain-containing protein n=1 Tax=Capronia epimyces CBS 606.96 TaxID=1182542 RepID=W9X9F9_9EURO|nr:uncharacterized protein A1O3_10265 [Capronia epimyces CBS 606.96]EXJ77107.1 hypothetical protein A1O3_10265 [Capronia epimyces CBS 606.96]